MAARKWCLLHLMLPIRSHPLGNKWLITFFPQAEVNRGKIGRNQLRHRDLTAF
jgi:hypothetical protein